jgi:hypothetical protein
MVYYYGMEILTWIKDRLPHRIYMPLREVWHWYQRRTRGWDDSDTWSLDHTIAKLVLPRIKRFKEVSICHPGHLTEQEWDDHLDKMIALFEFAASDDRWMLPDEAYQKHQEGLDLFAKYFWNLWW